MRWAAPLTLLGCINVESGKGPDTGTVHPAPDSSIVFLHDCDEAQNDEPETANLFEGTVEGIELCERDADFYSIHIEPGTWLSLTMDIDGSGHNGTDRTDLDLWELNQPDQPIDTVLDRFDNDLDGYDVIWASESHSSIERLAWFNASNITQRKMVMVNGFDGAAGDYALSTTESQWTPETGCDTDCNDLMLFPQASTRSDGYVVTQWTQYSHARRAVIYRIQMATKHIQDVYGDISPLGLGDGSQYDGELPGRIENAPRHPEGRHEHGNEIDLAYYQIGTNNLLREVCENDGAFCTEAPHLLAAEPTALLITTILEDPTVTRVVTDPLIKQALLNATEHLTEGQRQRLEEGITSGTDWPRSYRSLHVQFAAQPSDPIEG